MPQKIILYIRKVTSICILVGAMVLGLSSPEVSAKPKSSIADSLQVLHFQIGKVEFDMQRVDGGVFVMGGTREQHCEAVATDLPTHTVSLDAYYIATTEVTQALWNAVMPDWYISNEWKTPTLPITDVNWYDCQEFIHRLESITGMPFRLPTEAEWEFAARGGNKSKGYRFAGGDKVGEVSWGLDNAGFRTHSVGSREANELGLYDMTGNVSEWCSDWYGRYYLGTEPNPQGAKDGEWKVVRGGSFDNCRENSYLSRREYYAPYEAMNYCGLRLALTLPNDPMLQLIDEPSIVKKLKIKNLRVKLRYVSSEEPYYISEEPVNQRIWQKVHGLPLNDAWSQVVVDKSDSEWNEFLERCRKISNVAVVFATEDEVNQAIALDITQMPEIKRKKQHRWEKDVRSIQRHRKTVSKAQKWADLIGVEIKTTDDPILQVYNNQDKKKTPRWLVVKVTRM
jgi:hypothetical protein